MGWIALATKASSRRSGTGMLVLVVTLVLGRRVARKMSPVPEA